MATVWKHPNSPYYTAVFKDELGQWRRKSTKSSDRAKALTLAIDWERAATMGRDRTLTEAISREVISGILERTTGESIRVESLREFATRWLRSKVSKKSEGTSTRYGSTVKKLLDFLKQRADLPISAITPADCEKFYDHLTRSMLAPATLVVEMKTVVSLFNAARRQTLISVNPAASVELPARIKQVKRRTFTLPQIKMLLSEATNEWKTAILLGFYAGLRLSDAVSLTWDQIDLANGVITVQTKKTGDELVIPTHPALDQHFSSMAGDKGGPLCPTLASVPSGGRSGLSKQFLALMKKVGISNSSVHTGGQRNLSQLSFHALRKSFNSALHNEGVDQELRKKLTGHKDDSVNDRYTETAIKTLREAIAKLPTI